MEGEDLLQSLADLREVEPEAVSRMIREKLSAGQSHARARGEAVSAYLGLSREAVNRPNAVLAAEYLRSIRALNASMVPLAIRRVGDYHGEAMGEIASATAIRGAFSRGEADAALRAMPAAAHPWARPDALHPMDDVLLYRLRGMNMGELAALPDVGEGLEHRLYRLCRETSGREALLEALKCKRYTRARLGRTLTHALIGLDRRLVESSPVPTYARLLGLRRGAEPLLSALSERATLPIVSRAAELRGDACFELECRATDAWALLHEKTDLRMAGREYTEKLVRL